MPTSIEFCTMVLDKKIFKVAHAKNTKKLFQGPSILHQLMTYFENFGMGPSHDATQYYLASFAKGNNF